MYLYPMIGVEEAKKLVWEQEVAPHEEARSVSESLGYVLAEDIISPMEMPPFPQSAMDGYAIKGNASVFTLAGETKAGDQHRIVLEEGQACRVFTGSAVPENATAVIMQEKVVQDNQQITINDDITAGKNIRPVGEQLRKGELVLKKGHVLTPASLGILHTLGITAVSVYRKPVLSLILTGNELVHAGELLHYGQIYESNSITLSSALAQQGFSISSSSVKDDYEATVKELSARIEKSDVMIISGGISVGDYDFVGKALREIGVEEVFYKVRQKPGKPLFFGKKENKFVFALPGNPAAALTCLYIYVIPLLKKISGKNDFHPEWKKIPLAKNYEKKADRAEFLKSCTINNEAHILSGQASSMLRSFTASNALVYVPEEKMTIFAGEEVITYFI